MNYPVLSDLEEENAPWNDKKIETETVGVTVDLTISHTFQLELDPNVSYTSIQLFDIIEKEYGINFGGVYGKKYSNERIDWEFENKTIVDFE